MDGSKGVTVVILPDEGGESRSIRIPGKWLRRLMVAAGVLATALIFMVGSWFYFVLESTRTWELQALVDSLQSERRQVMSLARDLERVETEYDRLRSLFGSPDLSPGSELWLPPSGLPGMNSPQRGSGPDSRVPTAWPLTEPGFITQLLIEGGMGDHPGLDIAVPTDSYVRASGTGVVIRVGEDPIYGNFVVLEHEEGYQTVYAHVSTILVPRGQIVRQTEVIALSGSTGQSTAPHLHFEVLLDGVPVDPLSLMEQPS